MKIDIEYSSQIRSVLGILSERVELSGEATLEELIRKILSLHGEKAQQALCSESGALHPWILVDRSGKLLREPQTALSDGDVIRLMSPISGG